MGRRKGKHFKEEKKNYIVDENGVFSLNSR